MKGNSDKPANKIYKETVIEGLSEHLYIEPGKNQG